MTGEAEATARPGDLRRKPSGRHEWLYLIFLGFLFIGPAFNPDATTRDWILAGIVVAPSAALYIVGQFKRSLSLPAAATLLVVAVVGTPLGSAAIGVLPIYAAALVASHGSRRQVTTRLALITVVTFGAAPFSPIPMPYLLLVLAPPVPLVWLVGLGVFEDRSLSQEADHLRAENARIQHLATVTERERIARDLHDLAGQALTAVAMRSELVRRLAETDPERVRTEAAAIERTARETLSSLRETVSGWQQVSLEDELDKGLEALSAASVAVDVNGDWKQDLAPSVETVLALALRESLTNVVRHAHATTCQIGLNGNPGEVMLVVSDDGIGSGAKEGSGLRGMRERIAAAGGQMEHIVRDGTTLRVSLPVGVK